MSLRHILLAVLMLVGLPARAADPWSRADIIRETAVVTVSTADWLQTIELTQRMGRPELNPLLGPHPTRGEINRYFAASILLHVAITRALPARFRPAWQYGSIGWELAIVGHNASVGIRVTF